MKISRSVALSLAVQESLVKIHNFENEKEKKAMTVFSSCERYIEEKEIVHCNKDFFST